MQASRNEVSWDLEIEFSRLRQIGSAKLASVGLRIRRGCSYHGLALNVDMDLEPFGRINPCGYQGLRVVDLAALGVRLPVAAVARRLVPHLARTLRLGAGLELVDEREQDLARAVPA